MSARAQTNDRALDSPLEEIVVTAQKRSQAINDVGLAIVALDGDSIQRQQISTLADVAKAVPGLDFAITNNNTPVLTLRGIGFYESSLSTAPAVSVYVDEAPLPLPILSTHAAFDLERIEIMKGPQGTLFGQNSTGGALNYSVAKPTDELETGLDLSYARFDTVMLDGYVSGAWSDTVKSRVSVHGVTSDGWQKSRSRSERNGDADVLAMRVLTEFTPSDRASFTLNLNGWRDRSDPLAPQYIAPFPQQPCCAIPAVLAVPVARDEAESADWSPDSAPGADNRLMQASLRAELDVSDDLILTSISSYIDFDLDQVPEGDGTPFHILDVVSHLGSIETMNQELRLSNAGRGRTRWVVGANIDDITAEERFINDFSESSTPGALGIIGGGVYGKQEIRNYAVFGNLEYDLSATVALKAGARYTDSELRSTNCGFDAGDGATNAFFTFLSGLLSGQAVPPLGVDDCFNMDENFRNGPPFRGSLKEHNTSWRFGFDYKPNANLLVYTNVAKGYKGGSFPVLGAATNAQYTPVTQESVLAYEAGLKASLSPRLHANLALFHYDYDDKQLKSKSIDPIFGILDVLVNVPKTRLTGAELELMTVPVDGLSIQAALSYIDAEIDEYVGVNNAGTSSDFSGARVPYTPEFTARLNADYEWALTEGLLAFIGTSISTKSSTVAIVGGDDVVIDGRPDLYRLDSYTLLDLRAGVASADHKWRLTFFGRNVTDEFYTINASTDSDAIVRYVGRPATWGLTLTYRN